MIGQSENFRGWGTTNTAATWGSLQVVSGLGLIVCWLIWFARTRAIAEHLAPGRLRYRPSTAVLAWFIPVGNLYLPKQIANDIWHASSPPARPGTMAPGTRLHLWWGFWLAALLDLAHVLVDAQVGFGRLGAHLRPIDASTGHYPCRPSWV